jgi:hypothetical protein
VWDIDGDACCVLFSYQIESFGTYLAFNKNQDCQLVSPRCFHCEAARFRDNRKPRSRKRKETDPNIRLEPAPDPEPLPKPEPEPESEPEPGPEPTPEPEPESEPEPEAEECTKEAEECTKEAARVQRTGNDTHEVLHAVEVQVRP